MSRKNILIIASFSIFILIAIALTKSFTFVSNYEWKKLSRTEMPAPVLNILSQREEKNQYAELIVLDSGFIGKAAIETINSKSIIRPYWHFRLSVKDNDVIVTKIKVMPPFFIYDNKIYVEERLLASSRNNKSKQFLVTELK